MKSAIALAVSFGIALAVAVKLAQQPAQPARPSGSWEPADTQHP